MQKTIVKEAIWALSNFAAGPPYMIDSVLSDTTLEEVIKIYHFSKVYTDIGSECLYFLTNLV